MIDQAQGLRELMSQRKQKGLHYLTVTAGAQGVGKTSFAFNLAFCLQQAGRRPLLIQLVKKKSLPDTSGLVQALRNKKDLPSLIQKTAGGVSYLPQADLLGLTDFDAGLVRNSLLQLDSLADLVIFDAEGDSAGLRRLLAASHMIFILITAEKDALLGGYSLLKQMGETGRKTSLHVILNKAGGRRQADLILQSFAQTTARHTDLQISQTGFIRRDDSVVEPGESTSSFAASRPDGLAAQDMATIARTIQTMLAADMPLLDAARFLDDFLKEA